MFHLENKAFPSPAILNFPHLTNLTEKKELALRQYFDPFPLPTM